MSTRLTAGELEAFRKTIEIGLKYGDPETGDYSILEETLRVIDELCHRRRLDLELARHLTVVEGYFERNGHMPTCGTQDLLQAVEYVIGVKP